MWRGGRRKECPVYTVVYVHVYLLSAAWQPKLGRPIPRSTSSQGDQKVARVGRPTTNYKIVVRLWHLTMHLVLFSHCPTTTMCVHVFTYV